jgi:hypothetical protein
MKFLKMLFRRVIHFRVLFIEKYRYDENQVANPDFQMIYFTNIAQKMLYFNYLYTVNPLKIPKLVFRGKFP